MEIQVLGMILVYYWNTQHYETSWTFQLIIANYKRFCLHPRTYQDRRCGCIQDYGRTVAILLISDHNFFYIYLSKISRPEFSKAIIHTSPLQMLISTAEYKSAICHNMLDPVRVVTCINTMEMHAGGVNTVSKTLRFSSWLLLFKKSRVKLNSMHLDLYNDTPCKVGSGREVSDYGPDTCQQVSRWVSYDD